MQKKTLKIFYGVLISAASGLLMYSLFPPLDFSYLAWISLLPLLVSLYFYGPLSSFLISFLTGLLLAAFHIRWLNEVSSFPLFAYFVMSAYFGIFLGLFGLLYQVISQRTKWPLTLFAPCIWVAIEYIRSNLSFLAIPWILIGHSQYRTHTIAQIASVTSVYGISFLIVLINSALADVIIYSINYTKGFTFLRGSWRRAALSLSISLSIVVCIMVWGMHRVKGFDKIKRDLLTISLIQANIPQDIKWNSECRDMIMEQYNDLTLRASQGHPDLIIWPESATPCYLMHDQITYHTVTKLVREMGIPLLLGSTMYAKIMHKGEKTGGAKNTAFFIDKNGRIVSVYHKIRLLPFGEYLPLEDWFPWPRWLVPKSGTFIPGTRPVIFYHPKGPSFGVVICWENLFPGLFRGFVKMDPQFMVNLTNEGWFGKTAASRQILSMSVFRAIEHGISLLRCANTGISCLIDPVGRIQERVEDEEGNDIMVAGFITVPVFDASGKTFYTRYGDIFAQLCSIGTVFLIVLALLPIGKGKTYS